MVRGPVADQSFHGRRNAILKSVDVNTGVQKKRPADGSGVVGIGQSGIPAS
jgi:hypothetical protein